MIVMWCFTMASQNSYSPYKICYQSCHILNILQWIYLNMIVNVVFHYGKSKWLLHPYKICYQSCLIINIFTMSVASKMESPCAVMLWSWNWYPANKFFFYLPPWRRKGRKVKEDSATARRVSNWLLSLQIIIAVCL